MLPSWAPSRAVSQFSPNRDSQLGVETCPFHQLRSGEGQDIGPRARSDSRLLASAPPGALCPSQRPLPWRWQARTNLERAARGLGRRPKADGGAQFACPGREPLPNLSAPGREISSRSNSAMLAKMPNTRRPFGVEVSTPSCRLTNWIPRESNSQRASTS